ncbi:hypothetical protein ILUMI_04261 [Ignelater luminosus]|uniref:COMM domain-containing protein n=1 Tax=Ignelater luminosus TaxID=2038154 RepID=A0A8K0D9A7_IGNLU|nr:hypothetical protein ILUMI_04261 [Ignelater luminosus]
MANSLLKITNTPVLQQFLHDCVDDLIGRKHANFDSYSSDIEWTNEDYHNAIKFIQNLYRENTQSTAENILVPKVQDLNPDSQQCIVDCYEIRKEEILQAIIRENLSKCGKPLVENIDWKLKWILGSSKLASLREPLLQVDLHCFKKQDESTRKTINFEMNLEQVDKLIAGLEKVKNEINEKA